MPERPLLPAMPSNSLPAVRFQAPLESAMATKILQKGVVLMPLKNVVCFKGTNIHARLARCMGEITRSSNLQLMLAPWPVPYPWPGALFEHKFNVYRG